MQPRLGPALKAGPRQLEPILPEGLVGCQTYRGALALATSVSEVRLSGNNLSVGPLGGRFARFRNIVMSVYDKR